MAERESGPAGIRWDVLTIGCLSRNRYWGESDGRAYRQAICTTTLIRAGKLAVVVDPGLPPEDMTRVLDQRAGILPEAVDLVFLTHFHADHRVGLEAFKNAEWYMASPEIEQWRRRLEADSPDREVLDILHPSGSELLPGVRVVATPGHTLGHASLLFECEGLQVVVAGDAAMTHDFFRERDYYFNTVDPIAAVSSIETVARSADVVAPGHDNYFLNRRERQPE